MSWQKGNIWNYTSKTNSLSLSLSLSLFSLSLSPLSLFVSASTTRTHEYVCLPTEVGSCPKQTTCRTKHVALPTLWRKSSHNNTFILLRIINLIVFFPIIYSLNISCHSCIYSIKSAQANNLVNSLWIVLYCLGQRNKSNNTFPLQQFSELCSSHSNNRGSEFWYLDTTNTRRQTFQLSIPKPTQTNSHTWIGSSKINLV